MLTYKEIVLHDIEALSELFLETFNAAPWNEQWTPETASKRLHQIICSEDFYGICAYNGTILNGLIMGFQEQSFDGITFHIREFCTKNDLRGQGIGTQILDEFERRLREQDIKQLILFTSKGEKTEGFYHRRGLKSCSDMIIMEKQL